MIKFTLHGSVPHKHQFYISSENKLLNTNTRYILTHLTTYTENLMTVTNNLSRQEQMCNYIYLFYYINNLLFELSDQLQSLSHGKIYVAS